MTGPQKVSAAIIPKSLSARDFITDPPPDIDSILKTYGHLIHNFNGTKPKVNISFGSQDVEIGNIYADDNMGEVRHGSVDIQINNVYPENPDGTNIYGPTLIQKNNTYLGRNKKVIYDATVIRSGNVYPKNPGKNDIYEPIVIREHNIYSTNITNNSAVGAVVNQTDNTHPDALAGNHDTLNPIIPKNSSTSEVQGVVGVSVSTFEPNLQGQEKVGNNAENGSHSAEDSTSNSQTTTPSSNNDLNQIRQNREVAQNSTASQAGLRKSNSSSKQLSLWFQFHYYLSVLFLYCLF